MSLPHQLLSRSLYKTALPPVFLFRKICNTFSLSFLRTAPFRGPVSCTLFPHSLVQRSWRLLLAVHAHRLYESCACFRLNSAAVHIAVICVPVIRITVFRIFILVIRLSVSSKNISLCCPDLDTAGENHRQASVFHIIRAYRNPACQTVLQRFRLP